MTVQLEKLPDHRDRVIVVGTSVRKPLPVLTAYLAGLDHQELPPRTRVHYVFAADFQPDQADAEIVLREWVTQRNGEVLRGVPSALGDFTDQHPQAHQWSGSAMARVGQNKNKIIRRALELKADAVWFLDADVIADRTTLASLVACEKPIVCGNYWTVWGKPPGETQQIFSGPICWLQHPYSLAGRGMEDWEFRAKLIRREVVQVWGQGACSLIDRKVLEAGINFDYLPDVSRDGLMGGEDRHLCIRAERSHIPMIADNWPDQFHIYRPEDEVKIPAMLKRLSTPHPTKAILGDLVSLKIQALEPLPTQRGLQHLAPYPVRGRLGTIPMLLELEEAVYGMTRGQSVTVRAHCPVSHPLPYFRGRARLFRIQLVDCKPYQHPPILEDELHVGRFSGKWIDRTTLTPQLQAGLAEQIA
jgi:hypothetical protein